MSAENFIDDLKASRQKIDFEMYTIITVIILESQHSFIVLRFSVRPCIQ